MKILIIEDEERLASLLKRGLEENSFAVDISFDGEEGLYMAETFPYDVIILDVMLPLIDGFTLLERLRGKNNRTPVIMLTAMGEVENRIKGLNSGADDYIAKPFNFEELLARLTAVIRRNKGEPASVIQFSDLILDMNTKQVTRGGEEIHLSAREYAILEYLVLNKQRIISRTEFSDHVYDINFDLDSNIFDVYINRLRNKIDRGRKTKLIHTERGSGYILKESQ